MMDYKFHIKQKDETIQWQFPKEPGPPAPEKSELTSIQFILTKKKDPMPLTSPQKADLKLKTIQRVYELAMEDLQHAFVEFRKTDAMLVPALVMMAKTHCESAHERHSRLVVMISQYRVEHRIYREEEHAEMALHVAYLHRSLRAREATIHKAIAEIAKSV